MNRYKIICLTPVKNEAWILELFLKSASLWADHIIIADQMSDDGSREIASKFPKVILIDNNCLSFNEPERQKLLISEARKIPGKKLFIALDADEFLTIDSAKMAYLKSLEFREGVAIRFKLVNLKLDINKYWDAPRLMPFGFMDDGAEHKGKQIHSERVPVSESTEVMVLDDILVMHFQFADWERMKSKHRWYQCWEHINSPRKSVLALYRQYHHMYSIRSDNLKPIPDSWLDEYMKVGINLRNFKREKNYYWDFEVLKYINKYGARYFSRIDVWDKNWFDLAKENQYDTPSKFHLNLSIFDKLLLFYLSKTQPYYSENNICLLIFDKLIGIVLR